MLMLLYLYWILYYFSFFSPFFMFRIHNTSSSAGAGVKPSESSKWNELHTICIWLRHVRRGSNMSSRRFYVLSRSRKCESRQMSQWSGPSACHAISCNLLPLFHIVFQGLAMTLQSFLHNRSWSEIIIYRFQCFPPHSRNRKYISVLCAWAAFI